MVWYGSPEYNARLKAAAKRIALDIILQELLVDVARLHAEPVEFLTQLHAKVHSRFQLENDKHGHEIHVQAEAANFAQEYFNTARDVLQGKSPDDGKASEAQRAA